MLSSHIFLLITVYRNISTINEYSSGVRYLMVPWYTDLQGIDFSTELFFFFFFFNKYIVNDLFLIFQIST